MKTMRRANDFLAQYFPWFGIAGGVIITLAVLITAFAYTDQHGVRYSPFNHYISELGYVHVSQGAWLFNGAMVITGVLFLVFCLGLWTLFALTAGVTPGHWPASAQPSFAPAWGFSRWTRLPYHLIVATWYFRSGLLTVLLFGVAFLTQAKDQHRIPKRAVLFSLLAALAYGAFLTLMNTGHPIDMSSLGITPIGTRPTFSLLPIVEWCIFITTELWFLGVALMVKLKKVRRPLRGQAERVAPYGSRLCIILPLSLTAAKWEAAATKTPHYQWVANPIRSYWIPLYSVITKHYSRE